MRRGRVVAGLVLAIGVSAPAWAITPGTLPIGPQPQALCDERAGSGGADDGALRVATYNVLHTQDPEGLATITQRIPMLVSEIANSGADVVGMQEVAKTSVLKHSPAEHGLVVDLVAEGLAAATGDTWYWCWFASNPHVPYEPETQPGGGGGPLTELVVSLAAQQTGNGAEFREGVALLSRFPLRDPQVHRLPLRVHEAVACIPPDPIGCNLPAALDSRQVLHAVVEAPDGPFDLYSTHIAHGLTALSDFTKELHIEDAVAFIAASDSASRPAVFTGDFNTTPGEPRLAPVFAAGFADSFAVANPGHSGFTGGQPVISDQPQPTAGGRIDYVFVRDFDAAICASSVFGTGSVPYPGGQFLFPSDHLAVVTTLATACP